MTQPTVTEPAGETLREGDVVRYIPDRATYWCREGIAIIEHQGDRLVALDTFWAGDRHVLTAGELATAEVRFNLAGYRPCQPGERWQDYAPADREVITSQHGLVRREFVRIGAQPDLATRIANARQAVAEAEGELGSAQWRLECRRRELDRLQNPEKVTVRT